MTTAPNSSIRMIYVVGDGIFSPVLDSQVVMPLANIGRLAPGIQRALLVLTSVRQWNSPKAQERTQAVHAALPDAWVGCWPRPVLHFPFQERFWAASLRRALSACGYQGSDPIVVHCRGQRTAAAAGILQRRDSRLRILLDMRGAQAEEVAGRGLVSWYRKRSGNRALAMAMRHANGLNTVSRRLAEHLNKLSKLPPTLPRSVVGCCADTTRFRFDATTRARVREELGLVDKFVVCYCGAMAHWQRPDALAQAFAAITRGMPNAHFLVVSHESGPLLAELTARGISPERTTWRAAPHHEVASYLMAADVGLLLRENSLTNRVASPVKFAEYLRCGLPVILTPYVGDFSEFAVSERVGQTVEFPVRDEEVLLAANTIRTRLTAEGDAYRERCSKVAGDNFSWDAQIGQLISMYETLSR